MENKPYSLINPDALKKRRNDEYSNEFTKDEMIDQIIDIFDNLIISQKRKRVKLPNIFKIYNK